ncbi:transposase IS66 (plasmid) [Cylindrospermum sp. NIES-4074]|nr:transposase IS66 [Cylindrospermum sp. NIES-4074]
MNNNLPPQQDRERLNQLPKEELVETIMRQAIVIEQLQRTIEELKQEIERLGVSRDLDSKTSSKPPSSDLLKKPETQKQEETASEEKPKRRLQGNCCGLYEIKPNSGGTVLTISKFLLTIIWQNVRKRLAETSRKVSGGSRSIERFQDTANLLTVVQT